MIQPTHSSNRILRPARNWFIITTLLLALVANMLPVGRLPAFPDCVALILAFWCVRDASVVGQHSLAYVLLAYAANNLSRRILWFSLGKQALHLLPLLLLTQLAMMVIRLIGGAEFPGLAYFSGSFIATLLWYPLTYLLLLPQYQPQDKDENRPI